MNFDHLKKIAEGWTHFDWDGDGILEEGETVIRNDTGERYAVVSTPEESRHPRLDLRELVSGRVTGTLWLEDRLYLVNDVPPAEWAEQAEWFTGAEWDARTEWLAFDEVIGTITDGGFQYENPMSDAFLSYQAYMGNAVGFAMSAARSDLEVVSTPAQGKFASKDELTKALSKSGCGSYLSFQLPTGEWAFRVIRVRNAAGELRNVLGLGDDDLYRLAGNLKLPYKRGCREGIILVDFHPAPHADTELLARDEAAAEVGLQLGWRYAEALSEYLKTLPEQARTSVLDFVLKSENPRIEIQDLMARSLGMHDTMTYPPAGFPNGKTVHFFNAANVKINAVMSTLFEMDENGLIADDVRRLLDAGFEVVVTQCASSKDLLDAMYDDSTAGVFWFGHAGPGQLVSSHGFGIGLPVDVDWKRVSPSLKGFHVLGCSFTDSFAICDEMECRDDVIGNFFPSDTYVSGFDRRMWSVELPIQMTSADGVAKTVGEIIFRTERSAFSWENAFLRVGGLPAVESEFSDEFGDTGETHED